jgi:hypothetical protein
MGSKDKGKKETKKPPKPKAKTAPSTRKTREDFGQTSARIGGESSEKN